MVCPPLKTFRAPPRYPNKILGYPTQKSDFPGFEGHTKFLGPHPFMWKTPTPPEYIRTQKFAWFQFFRGRSDWTTGAPHDGNECKKYRVCARLWRTLLYGYFNRSGSKGDLSFPRSTGSRGIISIVRCPVVSRKLQNTTVSKKPAVSRKLPTVSKKTHPADIAGYPAIPEKGRAIWYSDTL